MRWLCIFILCRFEHVIDVMDEPGHYIGLFQCPRCKTMSMGWPHDKH